MTDESLLLLENITYLNNDVAAAAGITLPDITSVDSLGDYLNYFTEEALRDLESADQRSSAFMTGAEWAATIRAMKQDPDITSLKCRDYSSSNYAACFTDPNGNAYVAFQGTANGDEWIDNFAGLNVADTKRQKDALDYIESLPYDDITVVGHSKGGNKAMYVTITSDKVKRCVSMDGQGFSQEFLDKYRAEIEAKGGRIANYSLDTDYVHIILFPIPGSKQLYFANGGEGGARNHCSIAYFQFYQAEDGTWHIYTDENGKPFMTEVPYENQGVAYLHDFTCFIINVMPDEKKQRAAEYLGILLALLRDEHFHIEIDGVVYTKENLTQYILSDQETLSLVLAYVLKYADTVGLSSEEISSLLRAFGFGDLLDKIEAGIIAFTIANPIAAARLQLEGLGIQGLLQLFLDQIRDGKRDPVIETLLSWLDWFLNEVLGLKGVSLANAWRTIEGEYTAIGSVDARKATANGNITSTKIYNYSTESYELLIQTIQAINNLSVGSVSGWSVYSTEEWYGKLHVSTAIKGVNGYYSYLAQINERCKTQIDRIYENVKLIDKANANSLHASTEIIRGSASSLNGIAMRVG